MVLGCPRIAGCALSMNGWEGRWHPTPAPPSTRSSLPGSSDATRPGSENPLGPPESRVTRGPRKEGTSQTKGETTPAARWVSSKARPCHSPERDAASTVSAPWGQHGSGPQFVKNATSAKLGQGRSACTSQAGLSAMKGVLSRDRHRKRPWVMAAGTLERPEAQRGGRKLGPATPQSQRRAGPEPARGRFCRVKSASVGTYGKRTACVFLQRIKHPNATGLLEGAGGNMGRCTCLRKQWHTTCGRCDVRRLLYLG